MSLSTRILISLLLGLATGIFFGELVAPIDVVGRAFILLLQMTVLPYVSVSLVVGLGSLRADGAATLALRAGLGLLVLWSTAFAVIFMMPLAFPDWESASFFSSNLVAKREDFDFLQLFIPANPFRSMAETVVPAVVVFSGALGVALIGRDDKSGLMRGFNSLKAALSSITTFVIRLAPIGIFAIAANAAGTISLDQARSLQVYMAIYSLSALVLALWILPGLVATVTPYGWREVMQHMRGALLTAFATGSAFVVLSVLVERTKQLVRMRSEDPERAENIVDVVVPVAFTFPSVGKLLSLGFILFAGWVSGYELPVGDYGKFAVAGLSTYFGATVAAIPFLLDLFQIPADTFQLFLVADNVVGSRFGAMLGAMHLIALAFLATAAMAGQIRVRPLPLIRYLAISLMLVAAVVAVVRFGFESMGFEYQGYDRFVSIAPRFEQAPAKLMDALPVADQQTIGDPDTMGRIEGRGVLRVGYATDRLPWVFRNEKGVLVGFDVEMAHLLARELGVSIEFYPVRRQQLGAALDAGQLDVVMSGIPLTTQRLKEVSFSRPYVDETLAFIVKDHRRDEFSSRQSIRALEAPRIAVPDAPYYIDMLRDYLPQAVVTVVPSPRTFFTAEPGRFDAFLFTAESGSVWSLIYPQFTVAVPKPDIVKVPLAYAVRRGDEAMVELLSTWILLKERDGTLDALFSHWIMGAEDPTAQPRWSVWRNVLGFGTGTKPK